MKNITLALIVISTLISCGQASNELIQEPLITENIAPITVSEAEEVNKNKDPYNITFDIEKTEKDEYNLVVNMMLFDGAYFLAPASDIMFRGRFDISLNETESIQLDSNYFEFPFPALESDPFGNGPIMVQRANSTYKKKIIINTAEDFEISGLVVFTIEPKCTLEKIAYTISSKSGELTVTKN
ncbi:MAG: hypothetical protein QNK84_07765 [Flavobacteriales bacterium]|jgi:hypothetical protein|tara:strand:+ start:1005 stop:1556 length:552 start_codon:yes stop_codon:yes gene_type:complete